MTGARVSRRSLLGSVGAVSLSPALEASIGDLSSFKATAPDSLSTVPAFVARLEIGALNIIDSQSRWAQITGGRVHGRRLDGTAQGGRVEWRSRDGGTMLEVSTQVLVKCTDGRLAEIHDRGLVAADETGCATAIISTIPELQGTREDGPGTPLMLVGRLDASRISDGILDLHAFEVA